MVQRGFLNLHRTTADGVGVRGKLFAVMVNFS